MFAKGAVVKQKVPVIEGTITERKLNDATGKIEYHVEFTGADGHPSARWFDEDQLELKDPAHAGQKDSATSGEGK